LTKRRRFVVVKPDNSIMATSIQQPPAVTVTSASIACQPWFKFMFPITGYFLQ